MEEIKVRFDLSLSVLEHIGIDISDVEMALRTTKEFYEQNKDFILELIQKFNKPILLELWDERIFYFVLKFEFNFVDLSEKASALSTDQIDIENGERYNITYTDSNGSLNHPLILHCSPSGAIERVMYALLEKEAKKMQRGEKPMLPLWLCPTHIRFIPVGEEFIDACASFIHELNSFSECYQVRADIDDREVSVGRKIRDAEKEWVPISIVVGEKETQSQKFTPRFRLPSLGENKEYSLSEIYEGVSIQTKHYPQHLLPLPLYLSKRPRFK